MIGVDRICLLCNLVVEKSICVIKKDKISKAKLVTVLFSYILCKTKCMNTTAQKPGAEK